MEALVPITLFLCITAVAILRPISKRIGGLLEVMTRERSQKQSADSELNAARTTLVLEQLSHRLELIEERLDFTERLMNAPDRRRTFSRSRDDVELLSS